MRKTVEIDHVKTHLHRVLTAGTVPGLIDRREGALTELSGDVQEPLGAADHPQLAAAVGGLRLAPVHLRLRGRVRRRSRSGGRRSLRRWRWGPGPRRWLIVCERRNEEPKEGSGHGWRGAEVQGEGWDGGGGCSRVAWDVFNVRSSGFDWVSQCQIRNDRFPNGESFGETQR